MTHDVLTYNDLTFELRESPRRTTLEIIVDRDGSLVLATPPDVPPADLTRFIEDKLVWIYTKLEEKAAQARAHGRKEYVMGEGFYYLGRSYRLRLVKAVAQQAPLRLYRGRFCLRRDAVPEAREHFVHWYTVHLRPVLDQHLATLSERVGVRPNVVRVQDMGYRWGAADRRGHLYVHWRAALLPRPMIAYVVAHELVHLRERYHTDAFWARLARVIPDYDARRRWLADEGGRYDL
jgi:hypothetical protein